VRAIDHFAGDGQHPCVGMCLEGGDNLFGVTHVILRRRECGVDDRDLGRVDREFAGEAVASRGLGFGAETFLILEIGKDPVDWLDPSGDRSCETE
jgi:hypothetical protein